MQNQTQVTASVSNPQLILSIVAALRWKASYTEHRDEDELHVNVLLQMIADTVKRKTECSNNLYISDL